MINNDDDDNGDDGDGDDDDDDDDDNGDNGDNGDDDNDDDDNDGDDVKARYNISHFASIESIIKAWPLVFKGYIIQGCIDTTWGLV